jgi:feruloyl-CoA synthase
MLTGLGATETAPFFMSVNPRTSRSGHVGLPVSGNDAKLVPNNGKLGGSRQGPERHAGLLAPAGHDREVLRTRRAFYKMGDALKPADPDISTPAFDFDGRSGEDSSSPAAPGSASALARALRGGLRAAGARRRHCRHQPRRNIGAGGARPRRLPPDQSDASIDDLAAAASDPLIVAAFRERFQALVAGATGSSTRITRAVLLDQPLSIDRGEVTDKGSINQRAVLENRSALIEEIYSPAPPAQVITLS